MPNVAHKWTAEEESAVLRLSWPEFEADFGDRGISRDAYRIRKNKLLRAAEGTVTKMTDSYAIARAVANNVKMARSLIRLRHSIEADDELNAAIPRIRLQLEAQAADGAVTGLDYEELRRLIYGGTA